METCAKTVWSFDSGLVNHPGVRYLAALMEWHEARALGTLIFLSRNSQILGESHGTKEEIKIWCHAPQEVSEDKLVDALLRSGWIIDEEGGQYYQISIIVTESTEA